MPQLMPVLQNASQVSDDKHKPYPAATKSANGTVNGVPTQVTSTLFTDKIMVMISQDGRLAQWIQVPLEPCNPQGIGGFSRNGESDDWNDALPLPQLTTRTLLGASNPEREVTGQMYATQIASSIVAKRPNETRTLLVGLGLKPQPDETSREQFFDLMELVLQIL